MAGFARDLEERLGADLPLLGADLPRFGAGLPRFAADLPRFGAALPRPAADVRWLPAAEPLLRPEDELLSAAARRVFPRLLRAARLPLSFFFAGRAERSAGHNIVPRHWGNPQRHAKISSTLSGSSASRWIW